MGTRVRAFDWGQTPLGPMAGWPQSLRTLVDLLLSQPLPMILLWGPELTQIYNDAYAVICGVKHPAALGQANHACWPEALPLTAPIYRRVLTGGERVLLDEQLIPLDRHGKGTLEDAYFTVSYSPARDDGGTIRGIFVTVIETTAKVLAHRRETDAQLRRGLDTFYGLVRNNPFGVFLVDADFRLAEVSRGAEAVFARVPPPLLGQDFDTVLRCLWPEPFVSKALARFRHTLATGEPYASARTVEQRKDTNVVEAYDWRIERVPLPDGRHGVACYFYDLSERQRLETALREAKEAAEGASRAKDQFLAVLSHELRTPLTPVLTTAQLLERDPSLGAEQREMAHMIRRSAELEARLIDDLLDLTRVARGKLELHRTTVDVHAKVDTVVSICADDLAAHHIDLRLDLRAERHHTDADAARVQQIVWNLLKNAVKFTPPTGRVTIATRNPTPDLIALTVTDTGIGIDPERIGGLFAAFEQGGRDITRQFGGLGLGLAICKTLVEMHGGTITAASQGPNKGATFTVTLQTKDPAPAAALTVPRVERGRAVRVLLVEDHPDTRRVIGKLLGAFGCRVTTAATVAEAKAALDREAPDVLVSDIGLPDGTGLEVIRYARAGGRPVPGIALTGYGMEDDVRRSLEAGFAHHLTKPVDVNELERAISQVAPAGT